MNSISRRSIFVGLFAIGTAIATSCSTNEENDCDKDDIRELDSDCGYYQEVDGGQVWVWYPWVNPLTGGKPPTGSKPIPPAKKPVQPVQQPRQPTRNNPPVRRR